MNFLKTLADPPSSSLAFILTTYNHDGWVIFGLEHSLQQKKTNRDMVLFRHNCKDYNKISLLDDDDFII